MKKYYAGLNDYGVDYTYDSIGWQFFAFESKAARDKFVDDNEYDRNTGNIVCEPVARRNIPGVGKASTAIVKRVWATEYPAGCIGEVGNRYDGGNDVTAEF